jgi:hypothetical protein
VERRGEAEERRRGGEEKRVEGIRHTEGVRVFLSFLLLAGLLFV